ncbi:serine aminopeptidase domain-containing protein [Myceligenerans pegani]|uniref:Alpha/beta hydrolase n=1 Tax=Myceligenerans pegani TaxID=2776917 RepID=A0ABR9N211_9MICO|nr:alpha/beta hydrolase [Myceligenerans sp. TRM 65318]MBE1877693.1 alpha/beta hydrolase [Myceligenerans sp. TRM 65318]MBE3019964.1 alpha/beta hydrolase [Myceligenerans sp. TRM 65318]
MTTDDGGAWGVRQVVRARDGHELGVRTFEPEGEPRGVAVIVPAFAVPASFYAGFGEWLAGHGIRAVTFDYRGFASSSGGRHLREVDADLLAWAGDAADVVGWAAEHADGVPVTYVGHSLGSQILGLGKYEVVDRALFVAGGNPHAEISRSRMAWAAPFAFRVLLPVVIRMNGYYPGKRVRFMGNAPAGVMRQWLRWAQHPEYLLGEVPHAADAYGSVEMPIVSLHMTDDELVTRETTEAMERWYSGADLTHREVTPAELGGDRVGHLGFFKPRFAAGWDRVVLPAIATTR